MLFFQVCVGSNSCAHCSVYYRSSIRVDPNNDCGMHGILMSIFTDFIGFKSSLFKCNRKNSRFRKYLIDERGFDREQ